MTIIGQQLILNTLNNIEPTKFPKTILLLGEYGAGKHLLSKYIANNILNIQEIIDITNTLTLEYIEEIILRTIPTVYEIDTTKITEKQQNIILKLLEEPSNNSYIILLCANKENLLQTIINRCIQFELEQYKDNELVNLLPKEVIDNERLKILALNTCRTPGQIKRFNFNTLQDLYDLCFKIITKLEISNFANALTIANKFNYKDEFDKFDIIAFFNMMTFTLMEEFKKTSDRKILNIYYSTINCLKKLSDNRLNRQVLIENYVIEIWKKVHNLE